MHVVHPPRRHDRRREPVRLLRTPIESQAAYEEALDHQSAGMNGVALQILIGFLGTLMLIQLYAWATGEPGVGVLFGWQ